MAYPNVYMTYTHVGGAQMSAIIRTTSLTLAEQWLAKRVPSWPRISGSADIYDGRLLRDLFVLRFGFAILTAEAIKQIVALVGKDARILEVGAGTGYWSYELSRAGLDTRATDPDHHLGWRPALRSNEYGDVERLTGQEAVVRYPDYDTLLMVWPEVAPWPSETLDAFDGHRLVLCGEPAGGATGTDDLFEALEREWELVREVQIPTFRTMGDYVSIWERKSG